MSADDLLGRIVDGSHEVVAAIASWNGTIHRRCDDAYDLVRYDLIVSTIESVWEALEILNDEGFVCDDLVLGYDDHNLIARPLEEGCLVALTRPMRRGQLLKLQVSLKLASNGISKALRKVPSAEIVAVAEAPTKAVRNFRGVAHHD